MEREKYKYSSNIFLFAFIPLLKNKLSRLKKKVFFNSFLKSRTQYFKTKGIITIPQKGLTLIELIIVIVIISLLTLVIVKYFGNIYSFRLQAATNKLFSDIEYVQQLSITKQIRYGIKFNPDTDSYKAYKEDVSSVIKDPVTKKDFIINFDSEREYSGVDLVSTNLEDNKVEFTPKGTPVDGSDSPISFEGEVNLNLKDNSSTIKIEEKTGKVWIK